MLLPPRVGVRVRAEGGIGYGRKGTDTHFYSLGELYPRASCSTGQPVLTPKALMLPCKRIPHPITFIGPFPPITGHVTTRPNAMPAPPIYSEALSVLPQSLQPINDIAFANSAP